VTRPTPGIVGYAEVLRWRDGDTVVILPRFLGFPVAIRPRYWCHELHGGTVETRTKAIASKLFAEQLAPPGATVLYSIPTSDAEGIKDVLTFDRVLGELWSENEEFSISELMIAAGHAAATKRGLLNA